MCEVKVELLFNRYCDFVARSGEHATVGVVHDDDLASLEEVDRERGTAIVEGLNIQKKHSKPTTATPQGGIVEKEGPIHISNLMLIDPKSGDPTRVGRKVVDGKLIRTSKRTGEVIK